MHAHLDIYNKMLSYLSMLVINSKAIVVELIYVSWDGTAVKHVFVRPQLKPGALVGNGHNAKKSHVEV